MVFLNILQWIIVLQTCYWGIIAPLAFDILTSLSGAQLARNHLFVDEKKDDEEPRRCSGFPPVASRPNDDKTFRGLSIPSSESRFAGFPANNAAN